MKRRITIAFLALAVCGALAWLAFRPPPEPVYQGRPLTYWLQGLFHGGDIPGDPRPAETENALESIGVDAVPTLLRLLRAHDSDLKLKLVALAQKQKLISVSFIPAESRHQMAASGFIVLVSVREADRAKISAYVPELLEIFEHGSDHHSRGFAADMLGALGPDAKEAIPALLRRLADKSDPWRGWRIAALGKIRSQPELVVPALVDCLADSTNRLDAIFALENFGTNAASAVPALSALLGDPDLAVRRNASDALMHIDPHAVKAPGK